MGYCIEYEEGSIQIKKENMSKIIETLKNYLKEGNGFRWVDGRWGEDTTIGEIWDDLRYELKEDDDYFTIVDFLGEKYGSDDELFTVIAPYCEDGYLQFYGEDGEHFRFIIEDGKFEEKYLSLNWS